MSFSSGVRLNKDQGTRLKDKGPRLTKQEKTLDVIGYWVTWVTELLR
jgi:hypothetical protein